jgi:hypothetical protein
MPGTSNSASSRRPAERRSQFSVLRRSVGGSDCRLKVAWARSQRSAAVGHAAPVEGRAGVHQHRHRWLDQVDPGDAGHQGGQQRQAVAHADVDQRGAL